MKEMKRVQKSGVIRATKGKVILALFLACSALFLAWAVSKVAFREMLETVEHISSPNDRLRIVNDLSRKISGLDQRQKRMAFNDPGKYKTFFKQSGQIRKELDTLRQLYAGDSVQLARIGSIDKLLTVRDKQFVKYLKVREKLVNDQSFSSQLQKFNDMVTKNEMEADSTVVTSEKRTTTTTVVPQEEKPRGFFNKIFGKKKPDEEKDAAIRITNEENIKRDTIALSTEGKMVKGVEKTLRAMEKEQQRRSQTFLAREAVLAESNNLLIVQMLDILREVEQEAVAQIEENSVQAKEVVNTGIKQMTIIMVVFFLLMVLLLFLILTDITRSNKYRKELEAATEEAEYHGKAKQRFLSNMSHEIRTPLQSIIGYAEIIRNQQHPDPKDIDAIYHSSEHLLQIVNEILDYNRLISGKFTFVNQVFNIRELLDEVVKIVAPQAEKKALRMVTSFELENILYLTGDPFRLKQILFNLLSNAIKFTLEGEVVLQAFFKRQGDQVHFTFRVKDTGIGLSEEESQRIFTEFEQADAPEQPIVNQTGAGLGLTIVKSLVENQGGRIYVKSKKGQGSNFTFYLTFQVAEAPVLEIGSQPYALQTSGNAVWVVDDDQLILDLCSLIFKKNKFNFTCFTSPEAMLHAEWDPAVKFLLMDIRMPKMSGLELCRAMRLKVGNAVQIFAMTAQVLTEERDSLLAGGFDGLIRKPFRETDLLSIFNRETAESKAAADLPSSAAPSTSSSQAPSTSPSQAPLTSSSRASFRDPIDETNGSEYVAEGNMDDAVEKVSFDPGYLEKMTFGDQEQFNKILNRFITDSQHDRLELLECLRTDDIEQVSLLLHRLAGRLGQIGSRDLGTAFRIMEIEVNDSIEVKEPLDEEQKQSIIALTDDLQRLFDLVPLHFAV
ncbi:hybrid sensor histidine kinase/response regulator [Pedobacter immunditicola]|uniref:hybrid sensor histidine kinase/response regulator n=1 Tax=Pedobacter immunditicola TaxID=3133440 RepID=UPI0030B7B1AE